MPKASKHAPFDVSLSEEDRRALEFRLVEEIRAAKTARSAHMQDGGWIDFAYSYYEQQSQKGISRDDPRYGTADLTSPIIMENVDGLASRAVKTVFAEPLFIVEGIGKSAQKAPVVEVFMQWRQEAIRLQKVAKRVITASLVETGSVFEVCEDAERVVRHAVIKAQPQIAEDGSVVLDGKTGKPVAALDEQGAPVPADPQSEDFVEVKRVWTDYKRRGAYVRRRSMKDFVFLPSHAEDDREVWGHANRFWLTLDECRRREDEGEFEGVDRLGGETMERQTSPEHERAGVTVEYVPGNGMAEKELWRVQFWMDLDGKGLCFYTAVVSEIHSVIVSLKYDWLQRFRTIYVNPYPNPTSVYGYSLALTKLLTTAEEHTAWRNMNADRATLKANTPMMKLHGAQYDPSVQPFGPGEFIDVGSMNEIQPFPFDDVTVQAMNKEAQCVTDAQRIVGMNDIAIGQINKTNRTLGENRLATQGSFTRTDDPIGNIQEAFEELGEIIHAIEVQTLKDMEQGLDAPSAVAEKIQLRGDTSFDGTFTYDMVDGQFRFKPRGSSEEADPERRLQRATGFVNEVLTLGKVVPGIMQRIQTPEFADAVMQMLVTEYKPRDTQAFLKPLPPPAPPMMGQPGQPSQPMLPPGAPQPGGSPSMPNFGGSQMVQQMLAHVQPQGSVQ